MGDELNPRATTPNDDGALGEAAWPQGSLVEGLGAVVDAARQIATDLGARPYRVWSVVVRWTGGRKGYGEPELIRETELLPTPLVAPRLRFQPSEAGRLERGSVMLSEVSPRYTEDDLAALFPRALEPGEEAWIETRIDERDGGTVRRRFAIAAPPVRNADRFEWAVELTPQDDARGRSGALAVARDP